MRVTHRRVTVIGGVACSVMLFGSAATGAEAASSISLASESQLSGPAVPISVAIPAGWHQLADQGHPELLQMVSPETCTQGPQCATALARLASGQAASAQSATSAAKQSITTLPGIQAASVTSEGPTQIAGHPGYQLHFVYSRADTKYQAALAAVETGPAASGMVPISVIFVSVSDRPGAPPVSVVDQIIGSAQMAKK